MYIGLFSGALTATLSEPSSANFHFASAVVAVVSSQFRALPSA